MFLWPIGTSLWAVRAVFGQPREGARSILIGAIAPIYLDLPFRLFGLHVVPFRSAAVTFTLLCVVMLATMGQRMLRRELIFVVFGMFLYLVFSGAWTSSSVFWWPVGGTLPHSVRLFWFGGVAKGVLFEIFGAGLIFLHARADARTALAE